MLKVSVQKWRLALFRFALYFCCTLKIILCTAAVFLKSYDSSTRLRVNPKDFRSIRFAWAKVFLIMILILGFWKFVIKSFQFRLKVFLLLLSLWKNPSLLFVQSRVWYRLIPGWTQAISWSPFRFVMVWMSVKAI